MDMAIVWQVIIMALLTSAGFLCRKLNILDDTVTKKLSTLVLNFATPMVILVSYQKPFQTELLSCLILSFALAAASYVTAFVLVPLLMRSKDKEGRLIERFSCIYSNCAFMGIPLIDGVYGSDGVFCLTAYVTIFNICVWIHGVMMMKSGKPGLKSTAKALLSPCILATLLGMVLFVCNIALPDVLLSTATHLSNLNTPLAMMIAGSTIATVSLKDMIKKPRIYYTCLIKLIVLPGVLMAICLALKIDTLIAGVNILAAACPAAAICTMFALMYDRNAKYSSEIFAATTILSMVTLPLMLTCYNTLSAIFA